MTHPSLKSMVPHDPIIELACPTSPIQNVSNIRSVPRF